MRHIKSIVSSIIAIVVLFTTTGFTIYSHHCINSNTHNYSLLIPADVCNHYAANSSCCQAEKQSCCAPTKADSQNHDPNCCKNQKEVKKLVVDSILFQTAPILKAIELNISIDHLLLNQNKLAYHNTFQNFIIQESPPPILAPEYLSLIQVYII